jgi:hydrogenase-4 component F
MPDLPSGTVTFLFTDLTADRVDWCDDAPSRLQDRGAAMDRRRITMRRFKVFLSISVVVLVGIMALGVGLGVEAGVFGALLHMTYHSLAKPVALFSAGTLAQLHSSSDFDRIGTGTFTRAPVASALFGLATVILTGSPPFGMFFSEMTILRAGFLGRHATVTAVFLAALIVLFCGFGYQVGRLVLGPPRDPADRRHSLPERFDLGMATAVVAAVLAMVSSFYLPGPLMALIRAATQVVWGEP